MKEKVNTDDDCKISFIRFSSEVVQGSCDILCIFLSFMLIHKTKIHGSQDPPMQDCSTVIPSAKKKRIGRN